MQQTLTVGPVNFGQFVFRVHKKMLAIAFAGMALLFILYKIIYPFPDFYVDSYHYVGMAQSRDFLSVWPIGYSWFLRAVHWISASHYFLVLAQFLLLQLSSLWLAFTLFYYFQPPHWVKATIVTFLVVNPLYYYLANLVSSDILFTALSLVWLTILIRILFDVKFWHVFVQGPLLAYLFLVRYQAVYYPLIMIVVLWLSELNLVWKIISAAIAFVLLGWIVKVTIQYNNKVFGTDQFYGQGSWILADNSMYMYPYVKKTDPAIFHNTPQEALDNYVDSFFRARGLMEKNYTPFDGPRFMLADEVMWNHLSGIIKTSPGKQMFWLYNRMGIPWGQFGRRMVAHHPFAYIRYFVLPNAGVYLFPVQEQFDQYTMGMNRVPAYVAHWFHMRDNQVSTRWPSGAGYLMGMFRPLILLLNAYLVWAVFIVIKRKRYQLMSPVYLRILGIMALTFAGNALLLIVAAPVMMRYESFGFILGFMLLLLLLPLVFIKTPSASNQAADIKKSDILSDVSL